MILSPDILHSATGVSWPLASTWAQPLDGAMQYWEITTPERAAAFLAQVAHESAMLTRRREDFTYSTPERIAAIFNSRVSAAEVPAFVRQPERLANRVYANRYGNGDEASGDGWRYRGGGPIQITFRDNYRICGDAIGQPLEDRPELIESPRIGAMAAGWYWTSRGCNELADQGSIRGITRAINGGFNGLAERQALWERAKRALGVA